jgi:MoxR-like ATPase
MIRARVENGRWVLDAPVGLPEGFVVEIVTRPAAAASLDVYVDDLIKGYVRALLAAASTSRFAAGRGAVVTDEEEIVAAAKAMAAGAGRKYVTPPDVKAVAPEILSRLLTAPAGARVEAVVRAIMAATPVP